MTFIGAKIVQKDLYLLMDIVASGKVVPVIDKSYSLNETASALAHIAAGHARGKVVVTLE